MRMIKKHDVHIHTKLSLCSGDESATLKNYLKKAIEYRMFKTAKEVGCKFYFCSDIHEIVRQDKITYT